MQRGDTGAVLVVPGRHQHGDDLAAHGVQFEREPVRESVVTANHHVLGALANFRT